MTARSQQDERRAARLMLVGSCLVLVAGAATALYLIATGYMTNDWRAFYAAGELMRTHPRQLYDASAQAALQHRLGNPDIDVTGYPLPAFAACIFGPLSLLSIQAGYLLWFTINVALTGVLLRLSWRWLRELPPVLRATFLICALVLTLRTLLLGQVDLFVLAGLVGCYALLRSDRPVAAGVILSIGLFKPHLIAAAVLLLLVKRDWRAIGGLAAAGGPLLVLPTLIGGPGLFIDQLRALVSFNGATVGYGNDVKLMINLRAAAETLTGSSNVWLWLPLLVVTAAAALYAATRTWNARPALHPQSWALAFALPLLYSPHVHMQSMVLLVPAAALYLTASQSSAHPIVDIKYVLFGLVVVTLLWALTYAGLALMLLPIMATYTALSLRWPEPAAEAAIAPQQVELALAS